MLLHRSNRKGTDGFWGNQKMKVLLLLVRRQLGNKVKSHQVPRMHPTLSLCPPSCRGSSEYPLGSSVCSEEEDLGFCRVLGKAVNSMCLKCWNLLLARFRGAGKVLLRGYRNGQDRRWQRRGGNGFLPSPRKD